MKILALDLSTTACGWSLWDDSIETPIKCGTILTPTEDFKDNFEKIDFIVDFFKKELVSYTIDHLFVEEALKKLSGGNSSSEIIAKLIQMNFCGTYALVKAFNCKYHFLDVRAARKLNGIKIPRGENAKEIVYDFVSKKLPELKFSFKKTGRVKDFEYDKCDSIVIGLAAIKTLNEATKN